MSSDALTNPEYPANREHPALLDAIFLDRNSEAFNEVIGKEEVVDGYGSCSRCYCQAYEGNDVTCRNCGHAYDDHY
jgi:hypothetical protein